MTLRPTPTHFMHVGLVALSALCLTACPDSAGESKSTSTTQADPDRPSTSQDSSPSTSQGSNQSDRPMSGSATTASASPGPMTMAARPAGMPAETNQGDGSRSFGDTAKGVVGATSDPATAQANRAEAANHAPDNTGVNARDRNAAAITPMDQSEAGPDLEITAEIRRAIAGNNDFSSLAQNVKIITRDGQVTLRGPVSTAAERLALGRIAMQVKGVHQVDNSLEVAP